MSWNHRGGRNDWEAPSEPNKYDQEDDSDWSWPSAKDEGDGRNYYRGQQQQRSPSARTYDHRDHQPRRDYQGGDRFGSEGKWKHDKFIQSDDYNRGSGRRGRNFDRRDGNSDRRESNFERRESNFERRDSNFDRRDSNFDRRESNFERRDSNFDRRESNFERRDSNFERHEGSYDRREMSGERRDNWAKGGSWGNVERKENRDRSRSPPRFNDRRIDDKRYDRGNERKFRVETTEAQKWPPTQRAYIKPQNEPKTTLVVRNVPQGLSADQIREELERMELFVRTCQLASTRGPGEWSGVGYIEMGRVPDASYIVDECKGILNVAGYQLNLDYADTSVLLPRTQRYDAHNKFPTEPTDTMIVRNLDLNSTEKSIADAFGYITKKPILDIRLAKDRQTGHSRGFAFITWSTVGDCRQVLEYLQKATPKFNVDGTVVILDYANGLPNKPGQVDLKVKAANDAIAAAQSIKKAWVEPNSLTNGKSLLMKQSATDKGIAPHMTPHLYPSLPAEIGSRAPPAGMIPPIPPDQIPPLTDMDGRYRKYPNPNYAMFQWLNTHQLYYDPCTGLMWDQNSQFFYNQYKQIYLYWDPTQDTFVPVENQVNHQPVANPEQILPGEVTKIETGKKIKAVDIQKQMDSWMKQQKKTKNKPMSMEEADALRRHKKLQHAGSFASGSFGSTFQTKTNIPPNIEPPPPPPDMKMDTKEEKFTKIEEPSYGDEENYLDWKNFKCLLCRRAFNDDAQLKKHVDKSKLHKENLDKVKHPEPDETEEDSDAYKAVMQIESALGGYRDRAKERRSKYGDDIPPGHQETYHEEYSGPAEQPTRHGIGSDNKGAQLLQKMGWTGGTGLGKHRQGIINPIEAGSARENKTAGLGVKASLRQTPRSGKGDGYKQKIRQLTQDRWNDAGHG